jgi:hypothetical protein
MRDEQHRFLMLLGQLPARLTAEQAAWVLNCQVHDIPALVAAKLIKPLGNPPANGIKFFATAELLEASKDRQWLVRVSATIYQHWQKKNARGKLVSPLPFPMDGKVRDSVPASANG